MEVDNKNNKYCQICGELALNLCYDCVMYLCDSCFKFIHNKNININHKTEKIDCFVPFDLRCENHPKDRINLFCLKEMGISQFY